ncbi:MAG: DUF4252 domain-containing protein [Bacteroidaceae bacterium]|nr:DUF4252 domain-containing protein [Bacteroidaceae bacterium]
MRRLILLSLAGLLALAAAAQRDQDFAARFMALYGDRHCLTCKTISPKMMERIMKLNAVGESAQAKAVLAQLKGIRIVTSEGEDSARHLFDEAEELAQRNNKRYKPYSKRENLSVYVRKRGKTLVELVAVRLKDSKHFSLLDFTGNMSEDIIGQILEI